MYALNLATDGRILSATFAQYAPSDAVFVDTLPEGDISDWLYQDGEYISSPLERPEETEPVSIEDKIYDDMAAAYANGVSNA